MRWRRVALGLTVSLGVAASLPTATAQSLWQRSERRDVAVVPAEQVDLPQASSDTAAKGTGTKDAGASMDALAERALAQAVEQLKRGERPVAQRQIEILVARYPETPAAARARNILLGLYAGGAVRQQAATGGVSAPRTTLTAGGVRTLQDELIMVAGDRLFFDDGSADLDARARAVIAMQARWLMRYPTLTVVIEGYGDDSTGPAETVRLSLERSAAVEAHLVAAGVAAARISIRGFGDRQRIALCAEAICRAQNRRAVVAISGVLDTTIGQFPGSGADRRQQGGGVSTNGTRAVPPR